MRQGFAAQRRNLGGRLKRQTFGKSKRLSGKKQFEAVLAGRLRFSDKMLVLYAAQNDCGWPRLGISIAKAFGSAVMRNRMKRLIREAFRQNQERIGAGIDYVVMISPGFVRMMKEPDEGRKVFKKLTFAEVEKSLMGLAKRAAEKVG